MGAYDPQSPAHFAGDCAEARQALQLGIFSLFCFGFILGPLAIAKGLSARRVIAMSPGMQGAGSATTGIVLGAISLTLNVVGIFASLISR